MAEGLPLGQPHRVWLSAVAASIIAAVAASSGVWVALRPAAPRPLRLSVPTTLETHLAINGTDRDLTITPDGSRLVYVGDNGTALFVRPLDSLEATSLFRGAPRGPFVSPDGQWVGFVDGTTVLKKVAITGGPPVTITMLDAPTAGATWLPDDTIVFATSSITTGLQHVAASGGPTTVLTSPDHARGAVDHLWPEQLPGGRAILFTIVPVKGGVDAAEVAVLDRQTRTQKIIVRGGSHAHYVGTGHLVYATGPTLRAVTFDAVRLEAQGTPVPVVPEIVTTRMPTGGGIDAAVASDGTLAYARADSAVADVRTLVWVDRQGRETPIAAPPRAYVHPRVSPDGGRVVVRATDQEDDLWVWDVARQAFTRLTFTPGTDAFPVWMPDGRRLIFSSAREGQRNLFWQATSTGAVERLTRSPNIQNSNSTSPDGSRLIFTEAFPATGEDVMQVELTGDDAVMPLVQSSAAERDGIVSPDGRWLAYEASSSGQPEIFVRPYPRVHEGQWQVSTGGEPDRSGRTQGRSFFMWRRQAPSWASGWRAARCGRRQRRRRSFARDT